MTEPSQQAPSRGRLAFASVLAAGLVIAIAVVLLASSGESKHTFTAAPERCLEGWNDDPSAPAKLGVHQYDAHGYNYVEVLTLSSDGSAPVSESDPTAVCTILFASPTLDAEASAAALVQVRGSWQPLSRLQQSSRLAEYQAQAQTDYNAELQSDGTIEPL